MYYTMSDILQIVDTDTNRSFDIPRSECIQLELKHNVSSKGKTWSFIGDHLFNFAGQLHNIPSTMRITRDQYNHLEILMTKPGWEACRGV